jgi:hypothetical protein
MSWLDDLYKKLGTHKGSWGTPELGITENIAKVIAKVSGGAVPLTEQLGSSLFGAPPAYAQEPDTGQVTSTVPTSYPRTSSGYDQPAGPPIPDDFGKTTTTTDSGDGGGGGDGGSGDRPAGPSPEELAEQQKRSQLQDIANRIQQMRDIAQRNIGQARGVRDEVVGNIGNTFTNLRSQAEGRRDTALDTLGQEDVGVQNLYGRAGGTARRAMESALTRNRMAARAMNRLDSSFYDDRQAGVVEGGRQAVSDLAQEEAGKRAAIDTRKTETENWFEQQASTIEQEEATLKSQAEQEYQNQVNAASDMERAYGIDSLAAAEQAQNEFQSKLNQIDQYIQDKGFRLLEIATATGQNIGGVINQFSAVNDALSGALGVNQGLSRAQGIANNMPGFTGQTGQSDANYLPFYQQQGQSQNEVEERLRRIFGYQ